VGYIMIILVFVLNGSGKWAMTEGGEPRVRGFGGGGGAEENI